MRRDWLSYLLMLTLVLSCGCRSPRAPTAEPAAPRLILGSGSKVQNKYKSARRVTAADVTVNTDTDLAPTQVMHAGNVAAVAAFANHHQQYFSQVIFEHFGEGLASVAEPGTKLPELLALYHSLLKPGGYFIYESFRGAVNQTQDDPKQVKDVGRKDLIEQCYHAINKHYYQDKIKMDTLEEKLEFVELFYQAMLSQNGFCKINIQIKTDATYRRHHPNATPYYYLLITAQAI